MLLRVMFLITCAIFLLSTSAEGPAQAAPAKQVINEVALDKIMEWVRDSAPGAARAATAPRAAARLDYYAQNLRTLVKHSKKPVLIPVKPGSDIVNILIEGQKLKWEIIWPFVKSELPAAYPKLATTVAALEALSGVGFVVGGIFTAPEAGYGAAFEFCAPGDSDPDRAAKYVQRMLGTYEPAAFGRIAKRPGCADAMVGYLSGQ